MKVYAEATCDAWVGIKKGCRIEVVSESGNLFYAKYLGKVHTFLWNQCSQLSGGDWKRIEINEENVMPIKLEKGCYTKISHLSKEDQKRVLRYYQSFGVDYSGLYEDDDDFIGEHCSNWPYLTWLNDEDRLAMLTDGEVLHMGSSKHIPAEDILFQDQYEESPLPLLTQIRQAKLESDKAEEHLQHLLDKAYEELGDCGISFEY